MSGTILAQALTFALSFVLTRLYLPAEFGHYSIFVGIAGMLGVASTGAFDRVILLGRSDGDAHRAAAMVMTLAVCVAVSLSLAGGLVALFGPVAALPLTVVDMTLLLPAFVLCYAGTQIFTYSSLRHGRVRRIAAFKVGQSVAMGIAQMSLSAFKLLPGLIVGNILGWAIPMIGSLRWQFSKLRGWRDFRPRALRAVAIRNWRYPRYVMPNEVVDGLSNQVPLLLIGTLLSLAMAGHYGLAIMMLSAPATVIGQAVGQIFLQYIGRHRHDLPALRSTMYRIWVALAVIGIVPFGLILLFGPRIFGFAFGRTWIEAGWVAQHLAPLLFVRFVSSPTSTIYLKLNMQKAQWRFCLAAAVYRTAAYGIGAFGAGFGTMIVAHVVVEIGAIACYNLVALRRLGRPAAEIRPA